MLRKDIEDLQKRYQASERRCEELITQVPESTSPLLRQIEAMQETAARRLEASAAVERSLTSRLNAEAKAVAAEEGEQSINERLSQTLPLINVLEAQCEKLRNEAAMLPGIRTELEALRLRHSAALELMGERDEELEELRAIDLKEVYREQVNLLVNEIQVMSPSFGAS
ncbi:hypothetical protein LIER_30974 [Lithospermum erythrorhizon]|uniref:TATA element modulatory factor 1 TATA binding domain-containing protein n=1 Tax=Lithospermum erythrorhizon TaxID=34254 RepID=A0AAV3RQH7_LITER